MVTSEYAFLANELPLFCLYVKIYYQQHFRKYKQVFLLLVTVMESIKRNMSVNFVEGIQ